MGILERLRLSFFTLWPKDTSFERLGIRAAPARSAGLAAIVETFRLAYNMTLADDTLETLNERMQASFDPTLRGFGYEGVGMCLTLLDFLGYRSRVERFLPLAAAHDFLVPLGAGFALARLPWIRGGLESYGRRFPPGFDGLVLNGYGFHEACFHSGGRIENTPRPVLSSLAARAFDHGVGRALWFVTGSDLERIREALAAIPKWRHPDLWAGLGTAMCYAGRSYPDLDEYERCLSEIGELAQDARGPLRLGVVLAAMLQVRGKNPTRWVERAARVFLDRTVEDAGNLGIHIWTGAQKAAPAEPFAAYQMAGDRILAAVGAPVRRSSASTSPG